MPVTGHLVVGTPFESTLGGGSAAEPGAGHSRPFGWIRSSAAQLQRTRPTAARYQELVELIRAETFAHLKPIAVDHGPQPKA